MGWRIVAHSFSLLFRNLVDALKVSVAPILAALAAGWLLFALTGVSAAMIAFGFMSGNPNPVALLVLLGATLIFTLAMMWIAVAWHRFILLEEYPGLAPRLLPDRVVGYFGRTIMLGLLMILVVYPALAIMTILLNLLGLGQSAGAAIVASFAVGTVFSYFWFRLGLILPGTAVARPLALGESWRQTADLSNDILSAAAILVAINIAIGLFAGLLPLGTTGVLIVQGVVYWVTAMVGTSMLTTLYGHIVEGRPLP